MVECTGKEDIELEEKKKLETGIEGDKKNGREGWRKADRKEEKKETLKCPQTPAY